MKPTLRFLFSTAESHPTHRADVRVLFGKYLPRLGIRTDLLTITEPGAPTESWAGGDAVLRPARGGASKLLTMLWLDLSMLWRARRSDGVIVRDKPVQAIFGWLAARLARVPFVYWMSFPFPEMWIRLARDPNIPRGRRAFAWMRGRIGYLLLYRFLMNRAEHLFVQSDAMLAMMRERGLSHDRVTVVPMGVDLDAVPAAAAQRVRAYEGRRVAVYLGVTNRIRKPEVMIDAALLVAQRHPEFLCLIIGDADEPADVGWLRSYAERRGAGHCVAFTGWVPYEQGLALAREAEIGLSPVPRNELFDLGSPTKAIEYLALGLPVVCNDQPDQAWVVSESGGGLCVPLTGEGFADGILRCLEDPDRARAMGAAGEEWVRGNRSYRALAAAVSEALSASQPRRPGIAVQQRSANEA